jgi:hypothetical protein
VFELNQSFGPGETKADDQSTGATLVEGVKGGGPDVTAGSSGGAPADLAGIHHVLGTAAAWLAAAVAMNSAQERHTNSPNATAAAAVIPAAGVLTRLGNRIQRSIAGRLLATYLDARGGKVVYDEGVTRRVTRIEATQRSTQASTAPERTTTKPVQPSKGSVKLRTPGAGWLIIFEVILIHQDAKANGRGFWEQVSEDNRNSKFLLPGLPNPNYGRGGPA